MTRLGQRLYRIVQAYSALGEHRTGTPGDRATVEWFTSELVKRGARVDQVPYRFERYVVDCHVAVGDHQVEALPVYYEAIGKVNTSNVCIAELPIISNHRAPRFDAILADAQRSGADAVLLATTGAGGRLVALNRSPTLGSGLPAVLTPGSALQWLTRSPVHLTFEAWLEQTESANVVGYFGQRDAPSSIVVTTSLSGWFRCAGERGTGIAVGLHLAEELADQWPVIVVATTGHEFHNFGLGQFLAAHEICPCAVIHLGASVAAGTPTNDGPLGLASNRWAETTAGNALSQRLEEILMPALLPVRSNPVQWMGEAGGWLRFGVPTMSVLGTFPLFHTPDDLPERATSPRLLTIVGKVVTEAIQIFLNESLGRCSITQ